MATGRVTKSLVEDLKAGPKDVLLWDEQLRGFGLKVTPAGNKIFLVQYRMGGRGSPTRRYTIGTYGSPWTPKAARDEAERLLTLARQGIDPAEVKDEGEQKRRADAKLVFEAFAARFLEGYVKERWKSSYGFAESILRLHITPFLKGKPLPSIKQSDLIALLDSLPAGKAALKRNVYAVLRKLFRWAVGRGIDRSPLESYDDAPVSPPSRDRHLQDWELRLAWLAAADLGYPFGPLYRLLIGTGQRREEVAGLDWRELDRAGVAWNLPSARAKNGVANVIHLSPLMIAELDGLAGSDKWPRRGLVFSTTGTTAVSGYSRAKSRLDAAMVKLGRKEAEAGGEDPDHFDIKPWRAHDLRRTFATGMQRIGVRFEVTEAILNHVSGSKAGVAGVYQRHDWKPEKVDALNAWAVRVAQIVAGGDGAPASDERADETNVVSLDARRT